MKWDEDEEEEEEIEIPKPKPIRKPKEPTIDYTVIIDPLVEKIESLQFEVERLRQNYEDVNEMKRRYLLEDFEHVKGYLRKQGNRPQQDADIQKFERRLMEI